MRRSAANDLWPLRPGARPAVVALGSVAVMLASRRDVGDGLLASARRRAASARSGSVPRSGIDGAARAPGARGVVRAARSRAGLMLGVIVKVTTAKHPGLVRRHARKVRRARQLRHAVPRGRVPARRHGGGVASRRPDRRRGRRKRRRDRLRARPHQPTTRRGRWFAGRLALSGAAIVIAGAARRVRRVARRGEPGRRPRPHARCSAPGSTSCPTALVALGIGAVVLADRSPSCRGGRLRRDHLVVARRPPGVDRSRA